MDALKNLINRHLSDFPDFEYYLALIEKAEKNEARHPDICIECCNSLIQGISKTIILELDNGDRKEMASYKTDKLIKRALKCLAVNDDVYEEDFVRRCISLALSISTLRNARGDISHGKAVPKELASDQSLARAVLEMTATLLKYTLATFFTLMLENREALKTTALLEESGEPEDISAVQYDDNSEFNDFLDELNPVTGKLVYSYALYELFNEDYNIQLNDYLYEKELEEKM